MDIAWNARDDGQSTDSIDDGMSSSIETEYARPRASHPRDAPAHLLKFYGVEEYMRSTAAAGSKE